MTAVRKSVVCASLIAPVAYWFCLRFLFPNYFTPLFPSHPDVCIPAGLQIRPILEIFTYPRPISFLFMRSFGWMGVHASILIAILTTGVGLLCTVWLVQLWTSRTAPPLAIACYSVILFAQPQFYFEHRQDVAATQAFITALLAVEFWRRWVLNRLGWHYFAFAASLAMTVLTKETYLGSVAVLACGLLLTLEKATWKKSFLTRLLWGAAGGVLVIAVCEFINWRGYSEWVLPVLGKSSTYRPSFNLLLITKTAWSFLSDSLTWPAALILAFALGFLWRDRKALIIGIFLVAAGVVAILPNSLLPAHAVTLYAWDAAPLLFAPILVLPRRWIAVLPIAALICLWIWKNQPQYHSAGAQWAIAQEKTNERVLDSFAKIKSSDGGAYRLLVSGLNAPLSPWGYEDFVRVDLGDRRWTLLVHADAGESAGRYVSTKHVGDIDAADFDGAVEYTLDGHLLRVLTGAPYRVAIKTSPEQVLIPELDDKLMTVAAEIPTDFAGALKIGTILLTWGDTVGAQRYLEKAVRASNGSNPYPFFFLGQCSERTHDRVTALQYYRKAVAVESEPRNPLFEQAVKRMASQP